MYLSWDLHSLTGEILIQRLIIKLPRQWNQRRRLKLAILLIVIIAIELTVSSLPIAIPMEFHFHFHSNDDAVELDQVPTKRKPLVSVNE